MKKCPVCDRENDNHALTCAYCRRYLPQTGDNNEYSLISFLKKNEALFTIMGVFLVLAFIFNSPQLSPKIFVKTLMLFSFLCLWVSILIFAIIILDLLSHLKFLVTRFRHHLFDFNSKREFLQDFSIIIITPFLGGIAVIFFELLLESFPEYGPMAFAINILSFYLIEILGLFAVLFSLYKAKMNDKKRILESSLISLIIAFIIIILFVNYSFFILLAPAVVLLLIFGVRGLIRYFQLKNRS